MKALGTLKMGSVGSPNMMEPQKNSSSHYAINLPAVQCVGEGAHKTSHLPSSG